MMKTSKDLLEVSFQLLPTPKTPEEVDYFINNVWFVDVYLDYVRDHSDLTEADRDVLLDLLEIRYRFIMEMIEEDHRLVLSRYLADMNSVYDKLANDLLSWLSNVQEREEIITTVPISKDIIKNLLTSYIKDGFANINLDDIRFGKWSGNVGDDSKRRQHAQAVFKSFGEALDLYTGDKSDG